MNGRIRRNRAASLDDMALFVEVARARNFARASAVLAVPPATLSRRIAAMEQRLGLRLFDRTTRRVALTEAARRYFERCEAVVDEARLAHEALRESAVAVSGRVRVSMPVDLGVLWVGPVLPEFTRLHPAVRLELDLSPRAADLAGGQVDVALRLAAVNDPKLVARRIAAIPQGLYASPAYLERRGHPRQPAELSAHDCLCVTSAGRGTRWRLTSSGRATDVAVGGPVTLNNVGLMRLLAERGLGVAMLPPRLAAAAVASGTLERVLSGWTLPALPVHAVTSSRLQPAAVRTFVDFVAGRFSSD
jgi:DNA-binding transcriptional LysR family regulator